MGIELPVRRQISLSARLDTILFPFDVSEYSLALADNGYLLEEQFGIIPAGVSIHVSGIIGRKANAAARVDMNKFIIGVHTSENNVATEELNLYEHLIKQTFDLSVEESSSFYEYVSNFSVKANKDPIKCFEGRFSSDPLISTISKIIGEEYTLFGLRVVPSGAVPNQINWHEIKIEPHIRDSNRSFSINVVFRNEDRAIVFDFIDSFDSMLISILEEIQRD